MLYDNTIDEKKSWNLQEIRQHLFSLICVNAFFKQKCYNIVETKQTSAY